MSFIITESCLVVKVITVSVGLAQIQTSLYSYLIELTMSHSAKHNIINVKAKEILLV